MKNRIVSIKAIFDSKGEMRGVYICRQRNKRDTFGAAYFERGYPIVTNTRYIRVTNVINKYCKNIGHERIEVFRIKQEYSERAKFDFCMN